MRLYYASDVHGSEKCWRKFLGAARFYGVQTLVMGGDITGKVMVPIVAAEPGRHEATLLGELRRAAGEAELEELEKHIRFNGFYPYRCTVSEYRRLEADAEERGRVFRGLMRDEVARWVELAEERLGGSGIACLVMPGNDDEPEIDGALDSGYVVNPDNRVVRVDGYQVLSSSWTNRTPWDSPREEDEDALYERLSALARELEPGVPTIFNLHCPPYDSGLDLAPQLTDHLRVVSEGGDARLVPVGSRAVRRLIEEVQPVLALHGHVHESRGVQRIGRTLCVNPGSSYSEGVIDGAVVELKGDKVKSHQLLTG